MFTKACFGLIVAGLGVLAISGFGSAASDLQKDDGFLRLITQSKHTLTEGIRTAVEKTFEGRIWAEEVPLLAQLESDGEISIVTVDNLDAQPADSDYTEISGSLQTGKWTPEIRVLKNRVELAEVIRLHTLMSLSPFALLDILKKAEKDHSGTVFGIVPTVRQKKALFVVHVAVDGEAIELTYDLVTGDRIS
jgi:hypothetical protein